MLRRQYQYDAAVEEVSTRSWETIPEQKGEKSNFRAIDAKSGSRNAVFINGGCHG